MRSRSARDDPQWSPGANPLKNAAVLAAYGFSAKKDLLAQLLALNLAVAARLDRGEPVTAPGLPKNHPNPDSLVTADCIRPPDLPGLGTGREKAEFEAGHFYMAKEESPPYGKA